jgi:hypothetical protein
MSALVITITGQDVIDLLGVIVVYVCVVTVGAHWLYSRAR